MKCAFGAGESEARLSYGSTFDAKRFSWSKWLERTLASYPSQTAGFLRNEKDRFRNPVGNTLKEGLATLLDEITGEMDTAKIRPALESIVRLRAVQDFTPRSGHRLCFRAAADPLRQPGGRRPDHLAKEDRRDGFAGLRSVREMFGRGCPRSRPESVNARCPSGNG